MAAGRRYERASIGAAPEPGSDEPAAGFEAERIATHLESCADELLAAALTGIAQETAHEMSQRLRGLATGSRAEPPNLEELERTLTVLEEKLFATLLATTPEADLTAVREQASARACPLQATDAGHADSANRATVSTQAPARKIPAAAHEPFLYEPIMRLQIEKCIYGGAGLARFDGKAIFVPFTLPAKSSKPTSWKTGKALPTRNWTLCLSHPNERAIAPCEYFGQCGGCQYQHATYTQQVAMKLGILRETLERARLTSLPEILRFFRSRLATVIACVYTCQRGLLRSAIKSGHRTQICQCALPPIAAPLLERAIEIVTSSDGEFFREFDEVEFFTNDCESELLLSLWTRQQIQRPSLVAQDDLRRDAATSSCALREHLSFYKRTLIFRRKNRGMGSAIAHLSRS